MMAPSEPQWYKLLDRFLTRFGLSVFLVVIVAWWGLQYGGPGFLEWVRSKAECEKQMAASKAKADAAIADAYKKMAEDNSAFQTRVLSDHAKQSESQARQAESQDVAIKALAELLRAIEKNRPGSSTGAT